MEQQELDIIRRTCIDLIESIEQLKKRREKELSFYKQCKTARKKTIEAKQEAIWELSNAKLHISSYLKNKNNEFLNKKNEPKR